METKDNEIKYHKEIDIEKAKQLFDEAFRDEVNTIITPNCECYIKLIDGKIINRKLKIY